MFVYGCLGNKVSQVMSLKYMYMEVSPVYRVIAVSGCCVMGMLSVKATLRQGHPRT